MRTSNVVTVIAVLALVLGTLAAGCTAPGAQQAQRGEQGVQVSPEQHWAEMLEHHDADGNGTISQDEFPGPDQVFAKIDLDGNGQITQEEAVAVHAGRGRGQGGPGHGEGPVDPAERWARLLEHVDADGSGTISQDEFPGPDEAFAKIDADGNGQITQEEAAAMPPRRGGGQGGPGQGQGQVTPAERWARMLENHDADGSGTLSQDEFPGPDEAFAKIDADGNGQITQEEMQAAAQHRRQGGPGQGQGQVTPAERWARLLEHVDADGSGTISQDEFPGPDEAFAKIDADGNGQITQEEAAAMPPRRGGGQGGPGQGQGQGQMTPAERWARILENHDADGSGTLSQDEFLGPDEAFAKIDADGNGQITQEEMQAAAQHRRHGGGNGHRQGPGQGAPEA